MVGDKPHEGHLTGSTPLHWSAADGDLRAIRSLLSVGAMVNALDDRGQTALHRAAETGQLDAVTLLLANGANPSLQDQDGRTPDALAVANHHFTIAERIRESSVRHEQSR